MLHLRMQALMHHAAMAHSCLSPWHGPWPSALASPCRRAGAQVACCSALLSLLRLAAWATTAQARATARGDGSSAELRLESVASLERLAAERGPFHAVVVATGAASGALQELAGDRLPLQLCHVRARVQACA